MEIFLNSADPEVVRRYMDIYQLAGVTTNPKMIGALGKISYEKWIREMKDACGNHKFFTQVIAKDCEGMLEEAAYICSLVGPETYVKFPANEVGAKALRLAHAQGFNTCGTLIFSTIQAVMMLEAGADYIATFCSYALDRGMDPLTMMHQVSHYMEKSDCKGKMMGAAFRKIDQVAMAIGACDCVTVNADTLTDWMYNTPAVETTDDFLGGFEATWGKGTTLLDLRDMK